MQADDPTRLLVEVEHLLKTPLLAAIRRSDAALKREQPTREDLEVIRALCARMWSQLSAFRTFSRLSSNEQVRPNMVPITVQDLMRVIQAAVRDAEALDRPREAHQFQVEVERQDFSAGPVVEVDLNLFEMALREVIDNAVKYSDREGLIHVRVHTNSPKTLNITVSNLTTPMRPEEIKHLLEPGYRSSTAILRTAEGAGLGLFMVNAVMKAQNGGVSLENHLQTMTVKLELPLSVQGRLNHEDSDH